MAATDGLSNRMLEMQSAMCANPIYRYSLLVEWSPEDRLFVGYCPGLFIGGVCHDENRRAAYAKLVAVVEDDIAQRVKEGEELPGRKLGPT
jgi:hypothetical protein